MKKAARETYDKLLVLLDPKIAWKIEHPPRDPGILEKRDHDRVRIRILPVKAEMRPGGFWGRTCCYYEILVGPCRTGLGLCLGTVQFFRYANQVRCGGSEFTPDVFGILKKVEAKAPKGFSLSTPSQDGKFHFQKYYYAKDFKPIFYPCDAAAKDLAWLISETLPMLQALPCRTMSSRSS